MMLTLEEDTDGRYRARGPFRLPCPIERGMRRNRVFQYTPYLELFEDKD